MSSLPCTRTGTNVHRPVTRIASYLLADVLLGFTLRLDVSCRNDRPENVLCRDIHEGPRSIDRDGGGGGDKCIAYADSCSL